MITRLIRDIFPFPQRCIYSGFYAARVALYRHPTLFCFPDSNKKVVFARSEDVIPIAINTAKGDSLAVVLVP